MPIDFTQGMGQGLPDFIGRIREDQQKEADRQAQFALAMQQIATQERMAQPNQLDIAKDQRAAALDEVKLARERQAMGIDLAQNEREALKTGSSLLSDEKQREKIDNDISLMWKNFNIDSDIKYKDYGLRKDMQSFNKDQMRTKLGYEIKWGDNQDDREERKFGFEINKWKQQEQQKQDMRDALSKARQQGEQEIYNTLVDNGMMNEANLFSNSMAKMQETADAKLTKEAEKRKEEVFYQLAPTVLQTGTLNKKQAIQYLDQTIGQDATTSMIKSGVDVTKAGTVAFLTNHGKTLGDAAGDPDFQATIASTLTGNPVKIKVTDNDTKEIDNKINFTYTEAHDARELQRQLNLVQALNKTNALSGLGPDAFQTAAADVAQALSTVGNYFNIDIKTAADLDRAKSLSAGVVEGIKLKIAEKIPTTGASADVNARLLNQLNSMNSWGNDEFDGFSQALNLKGKQDEAKLLDTFLDNNQGQMTYRDFLTKFEKEKQKGLQQVTYSDDEIAAELASRGIK